MTLLPGSWTYARLNVGFTVAIFALPISLGPNVIYLHNGALVWCLAATALGIIQPSRERHVLAVTAALWIYCLTLVLAVTLNPNFNQGLALSGGLLPLALFPFSYASWRVSDKADILRACLIGCAIAAFSGLLIAAFQVHALSVDRAVGGAKNALIFANVMAMCGLAAFAGSLIAHGRERIVQSAAFFASVLAIVYSQSRGPLVLILVGVVLAGLIHVRRETMTRMRVTALATGFLILVAVAVLMSPMQKRVGDIVRDWSRMETAGDFDSPVGLRIAMWRAGYELWLDRPWFGHGAANMESAMAERLKARYGLPHGFNHFHNLFLNTLVEGGVVSLAALLGVMVTLLVIVVRVLRRNTSSVERFGATMIVLILTNFLVMGATNTVLHQRVMDVIFLTFLVVGLYLAAGRPGRTALRSEPPDA